MPRFLLLLPVAPILALMVVAEAGATLCASGAADVEAAEPNEVETVCEAADAAAEVLRSCGVTSRKAVRFVVAEQIPDHYPAHILALYDPAAKRITVPTFAASVGIVGPRGQFGVPITPALYRGLLSHEFAHAVVDQIADGRLQRLAHEYIAYATQFAVMEPALREEILAGYPHQSPIILKELNELYYALSPDNFAIKVYLHFTTPENGCGFIQNLLQEREELPSLLQK